jgi:uncharacterized protein with HEPN domain
MKDDGVYLDHIIAAIAKIESFTKGISQKDFSQSVLIQDAVIRNFEIIGEATKQLSVEFTQNHPKIPWQNMAGMRDKLIHDYIDVDLDVVWETIISDLPFLKNLISNI